jgi:hypothetical protein
MNIIHLIEFTLAAIALLGFGGFLELITPGGFEIIWVFLILIGWLAVVLASAAWVGLGIYLFLKFLFQ